jgi:hypothetical protein
MKGAGKKPIPYIATSDKELKPEEQTITWVRPKNTKMGSYSSRRYTAAFTDAGQIDSYNPEDWYEATVEDFCECVARIDNYAFSEDYLENHPDIKKDTNEAGFYTKPIVTPVLIRDVAEDATDGYVTEILNVSSNKVRLDQGAKKNLSWSQSLRSGDPLPPLAGDPTTA